MIQPRTFYRVEIPTPQGGVDLILGEPEFMREGDRVIVSQPYAISVPRPLQGLAEWREKHGKELKT